MSGDRLTVMLTGLEVFGRHGVYAPETELGQRFVVDLEITLAQLGREPLRLPGRHGRLRRPSPMTSRPSWAAPRWPCSSASRA